MHRRCQQRCCGHRLHSHCFSERFEARQLGTLLLPTVRPDELHLKHSLLSMCARTSCCAAVVWQLDCGLQRTGVHEMTLAPACGCEDARGYAALGNLLMYKIAGFLDDLQLDC